MSTQTGPGGAELDGSGLDSPGARLLQARGIENSAFTRFMGTRLRAFAPGRVEAELDLRSELTQHHGQAHGGVIGYLADTVSAWAAASTGIDVVTSEYKLNFLAAAHGEVLWARGEVLKAGRRQVIVRSDVYTTQDGQDTHVATALATIAAVNGRKEEETNAAQ